MTNKKTTTSVTKEALQAYAGKNGEYYARFLKRYQLNATFLSWNWVAFFFLPYWLAYRKLWWPLAVVIGSQAIVLFLSMRVFLTALSSVMFKSVVFDQLLLFAALSVISIVGLGITLLANSFYLKQAAKHIHASDGALNTLQGKGRSMMAVIAVFLLAGGFGGAYLSSQVMAQEQSRLALTENNKNNSDESTTLFSAAKSALSTRLSSKMKTLKAELEEYNYNRDEDQKKLLTLLAPHDDLSSFNTDDDSGMGGVVYFSFRNKDFATLQLLVDKKLNIEQVAGSLNRNFLESSYEQKNWPMMQFLIEKAGFKEGDVYLMKPDGYEGKRPLQSAIDKDDLVSARWMIERKIPVTAKYYKGLSPLMLAVSKKQPDIVRLLLEKGANPNYKDMEGRSATALAQESDNEAIIALFADSVSN